MSDLQGKRILVVDDNLTNRAILKSQLEIWKLMPVMAGSAIEALDLLQINSSFDLVLTDMQMPLIDGIQLAEQIKEKYPALPIILLSSIGDEYNKYNFVYLIQFWTKPIKQHILSKNIVNVLHADVQVPQQAILKDKLYIDFATEFLQKYL